MSSESHKWNLSIRLSHFSYIGLGLLKDVWKVLKGKHVPNKSGKKNIDFTYVSLIYHKVINSEDRQPKFKTYKEYLC